MCGMGCGGVNTHHGVAGGDIHLGKCFAAARAVPSAYLAFARANQFFNKRELNPKMSQKMSQI